MNAHALLTSQGWRGTGHSLHPTSDTTGLSRPLLVSKKQNNLGVGKKQHKTSDMWWMNAFDKSLQGLDTSQEGKVVQNLTNGGLDMVAKGGARFVGNGGGLYASFVRGECLSGTITPDDEEEREDVVVSMKMHKREDGVGSKEERRARKAAKRLRREQKSVSEQESVDKVDEQKITKSETKEERRERKRLKKVRREAERNEEATSEKAKKKKRRKE